MYAFLLAAGLRWGDISSPDWLSASAKAFGVAVSIGGMLIIGMNLTEVNFKRLNKRFLAEMMGIRLVAGVLLTGLLLFLERQFFGWLEEESLHMMALLPLFPIAANVTLFASYLDADEGATATWVLVSMLLSLLLIPLASLFF
ncbi:hypothetical protein [Nitritalea halalkaliphila]|uniref:hypothetical protein n=1 Tax=Nitritalea halalkaliphila TaxID=590849 RepID=UPI000317E33C|nr:hypothetical protein [Nitritalea halalkaliphila]